MRVNRLDLQAELEAILGSKNVYFNPPPEDKMKYPAIRYNFEDVKSWDANNKRYINRKFYTITLIHRDPDNEVVDKLLNAGYTMSSRPYTADGLYHYVFETYL